MSFLQNEPEDILKIRFLKLYTGLLHRPQTDEIGMQSVVLGPVVRRVDNLI